jgi:hypothetical protein
MWWVLLSIHALEETALCASWKPDGEQIPASLSQLIDSSQISAWTISVSHGREVQTSPDFVKGISIALSGPEGQVQRRSGEPQC